MIRERIFRLNRHKSSSSSLSSSGQKFDFTFSNIQALQVPKGWDKVTLSLISSDSGKTARKSGKVPVKNGTCKWTETYSESVWISDNDTSKEMDDYLFKFLVSTGSSRSSVLGETMLNLTAFLSSESPVLVSLPLKNCNYGTILQVEVRCLTPKMNLRDEKWKEMHARDKHESADHEDVENRSEISDSTTFTKSIDSCSSDNLGTCSRPRELVSRETSFSASVSSYSFDSIDDSVGRQSISSQSEKNMGNNVIGRQESVESNDSASYCSYSTHSSIKSVRSFHREEFKKPKQNGFKEVCDAKVQELEAEARMWEQNARKLAFDLESSRKELFDNKLNMTNSNVELATSRSECQKLTQEIEHLKLIQETESIKMQKDLEDEIRFQKESNENLSSLLKKTQESNVELISVFQEMEETIEKQKLEIESLSANKLEFMNTNEQIRRENIMVLKSTLEEKIIGTEIEQDLKNRILKEFVVECNSRLASKQHKIKDLETILLSRALSDENLENFKNKGNVVDERKEIGGLKENVRELETDCNELTVENVGPLFQLKELRNVDRELQDNVGSNEEQENDQLIEHLSELQDENIYLSQRVSGLEAQLRYLTDTNESSRLELEQSESQGMILQNQIRKLEEKIESQKLDTKHKLLEMEKRWIETREECTSLSVLNVKLQTTTENLVEEYNSMHKFNEELREQKMELKNQCMVLELEARKLRDCLKDSLFKEEITLDGVKENIERSASENELESKLKFSELERLRLAEENCILRMQSQKVAELQNEVLSLRISLKETKSRMQILKASFESVLQDYEELKCENSSMLEKVSNMQKAVLEAESYRRKKNALEEKILRLEGDLIARDASSVQDAEMKNELNRIKISNSQFRMKVKQLEDVRECLQSRVKVLEDERWTQQMRLSKDDFEIDKTKLSIDPSQSHEYLNIQDNQGEVQVSNKQDSHTRIQLLESELEKALKANDTYKSQLESAQLVSSEKSEPKETMNMEEYKISQLEGELQEIRDRYLQISLKYAEVEAQREQLVMKLKAFNT